MKALTARERITTVDNFKDDDTLMDNSTEWIILAVCDKAGAAIFTEGDAKAIGELSAAVVQRMMKAIQDKAGMTAEVQEQLAKNSEEATADNSPSS